ncbi:MAG: hypothetical protein P4L83_23925 [Nevskia sp.]|nr:hypothetical protein [Nevskia sp.]
MDLQATLLTLPRAAVWGLSLLQIAVLALAGRLLPWRPLAGVPARLHLLGGAFLFLFGLWGIHARVHPLFGIHPLGVTTVTLLLGAPLALWVGTLAQLADLALRGGVTSLLLADSLLNVSLPVAMTAMVLRLAVRHGPRNLYVYLLGVGFLGGGLSMLAVCLCTLLLIALGGHLSSLEGWPPAMVLLLMFPEGFVNGALVSLFAVYVPGWMKTFDDRHFLPE